MPVAPAKSAPRATKKVEKIAWWRMLLLLPLVLCLRLLTFSLRWQIDDTSRHLLMGKEKAYVFATWHNRLIVVEPLVRMFRKGLPMSALISASKDGAWLVAFFRLMKIDAVRGSSSFRASQAVKELMQSLARGTDIAITPDGPRGPKHKVKAGMIQVALKKDAPLVLIGASYQRKWVLGSWDAFEIPKPFSRVAVRVETMEPSQLKSHSLADQSEIIEKCLFYLENKAENALLHTK